MDMTGKNCLGFRKYRKAIIFTNVEENSEILNLKSLFTYLKVQSEHVNISDRQTINVCLKEFAKSEHEDYCLVVFLGNGFGKGANAHIVTKDGKAINVMETCYLAFSQEITKRIPKIVFVNILNIDTNSEELQEDKVDISTITASESFLDYHFIFVTPRHTCKGNENNLLSTWAALITEHCHNKAVDEISKILVMKTAIRSINPVSGVNVPHVHVVSVLSKRLYLLDHTEVSQAVMLRFLTSHVIFF